MDILEFRGETRWLSNFEEAKVMLDGTMYPTVEHAYQAAKTINMAERAAIKACKTPAEAKKMGMTVTLREDWEDIKLGVMMKLNLMKFKLHPELKAKLLATGDAHLEEGNHWGDTFWGTVDGVGKNHLGKILMEVRRMLK